MNYQYAEEQKRAIEQEQIRANEAAVRSLAKPAEARTDPAAAQLLVLFQMSDKRGQDLLLAIAAIHAARYPKVK